MHDSSVISSDLDEKIRRTLEDFDVPGGVVVAIRGKCTEIRPYGKAKMSSDETVTEKTAFNIASTSKAYVSTACAMLVAEGKLQWDDPISNYVPEFVLYDDWITKHATIRDLSGNRLGLPRDGLTEFGFNEEISSLEIFQRLRYVRPSSGFREKFTYVNPGHTAVAVAIERITGMTFLDFLKTRIYKPLGFINSSGGSLAKSELSDISGWHLDHNGETIEIVPRFIDNYLGSGGLWSCGHDTSNWMAMHLDRGEFDDQIVIPREALMECYSPQIRIGREDLAPWIGPIDSKYAAYCLGWALSEFEDKMILRHSGSDLGASAQIALCQEDRVGVAVFLNKNTPAALEINYLVLADLMNVRPRNWHEVVCAPDLPSTHESVTRITEQPDPEVRPDFDLESYTGVYRDPGQGDVLISADRDHLSMDFADGDLYSCNLYSRGGHEFLPIAKHVEYERNMRVPTRFVIEKGQPAKLIVPETGTFVRTNGLG